MHTVTLCYWAGARSAAGTGSEAVPARSVQEALETARAARADARFSRVVQACSFLVDGTAAHADDLERELSGPVRVDVLPPFAGGAGVRLRAYARGSAQIRPVVLPASVSEVTDKRGNAGC